MSLKRVILCEAAFLLALYSGVFGFLALRPPGAAVTAIPSGAAALSLKLGRIEPASFSLDDCPEKLSLQQWIGSFSGTEHAAFLESLHRGDPYRSTIEGALLAAGVPRQFYYVPLIESRYLNAATSEQGAAGIWQLRPDTGRRYGLTVNQSEDERRDPAKASAAAARYLRDLHLRFHSWAMALAAYNFGEDRLARLLERTRFALDFWSLAREKKLPPETREFVPKVLAAVMVAESEREMD